MEREYISYVNNKKISISRADIESSIVPYSTKRKDSNDMQKLIDTTADIMGLENLNEDNFEEKFWDCLYESLELLKFKRI